MGAKDLPLWRQPHPSVLDDLVSFSTPASPNSTPLPLDGPSGTRRSASRNASPGPSSFVYRPPRERRGGFHPVTDVPTDCQSTDDNIQTEHQAYDANPMAAPTAWGYRANAPERAPPIQSLPMNQGITREGTDLSQTEPWHCAMGGLTLAPLREGMQAQLRNEAPVPFSYPGAGHVPSSDQRWMHPPTDNHPSTVYFRPNPRMLFD
jgi:hypothetical protein